MQFAAGAEPRIRIEADYQLRNSGNQPLNKLELLLPGRRRFRYEQPHATWDKTELTPRISENNPRNAVLALAEPWVLSARHALHLSVEYLPGTAGDGHLSFSNDAFFLPAEGWSPELLPAQGLFAKGGVPPQKWELSARVPERFLIHTSGERVKTSRSNGEIVLRATQGTKDLYPFLMAGDYSQSQTGSGKQKIILWTKKGKDTAGLQQLGDALIRTMEAYDAILGERTKNASPLWVAECPVASGCFTNLAPLTAALLGEDSNEPTSAEMISGDAMIVDFSGGAPKLAAAAAPSLAASWLGYAQNPGFYERDPPLSLLPAFAASVGREAAEGTDSRSETIRHALGLIPTNGKLHQAEDRAVVRAKSFLFFYGLQDRYGREVFQKAIQHMLYARRERGIGLSDLIAAFDQETHENAAEFVRMWMKRPGVPDDFRKRYEGAAAAGTITPKETTP